MPLLLRRPGRRSRAPESAGRHSRPDYRKKRVKANFKADNFVDGVLQGSASGTMCLQGEKFHITTPEMVTWYNGETQWSYIKANEEVNVSVPTEEEKQSMNPYSFVGLYKKGYDCQMKETTLRGKPCYEVTLTAQDRSKKPAHRHHRHRPAHIRPDVHPHAARQHQALDTHHHPPIPHRAVVQGGGLRVRRPPLPPKRKSST